MASGEIYPVFHFCRRDPNWFFCHFGDIYSGLLGAVSYFPGAFANVPVAMAKVFGFYLVFTPLSTWLGHLAEGVGVNDFIILIVTMLLNFVLEFLFCKFVVYRGQEDTL